MYFAVYKTVRISLILQIRFRSIVVLRILVFWALLLVANLIYGSLMPQARCYTALYQNKPVAFIAVVQTPMKARYYRVTRLVVLPDYQGIGVGKRLLNFIAELCTSQTKIPFYLLTGNPQIVRGNLDKWRIKRGHASKGKNNSRINNEIKRSLSRNRLSISLQYNLNRK